MKKVEKKFLVGTIKFALFFSILIAVSVPFAWTCVKVMHAVDNLNEKIAYEAIQEIDGIKFEDLSDKEAGSKQIKVYKGMEYPWDKQIILTDKKTKVKVILFIENDGGVAKVVDVNVNGEQVNFK